MNWGKLAAIALLGSAIAAGAGMWYAQEYGYYDPIDPNGPAPRLTSPHPPASSRWS